jgi:flagellar biosynthesis protein
MSIKRYRQAVALEYGRRATPVVTAKADEELALQLVQEALRHGVHLAQDPRLVAVLSKLDIDQEIPRDLYTTVAVVLSWVYWLKGMRPGDEKR